MIETGDLGEIKRVKVELKGESDYSPDSEYFKGIAEKFFRYAGVEVVDEGYDAVLRVYITLEIYEDDEEVSGKISFISDVVRFSAQFRSETFITAMTELILKIFGIQPLKKVLKRESRDFRAGVARALGEIGDAKAVDALIETLKDEDSYVRSSVAEALGKIRNARSVHALIEALRDRDSDVRRSVAWALGEIGDARAVDALIEALKVEETYVRISVARALGKIRDSRAVDALIEALKDENSYVRKSVAWALGEIGDARAVDELVRMLNDEDSDVRESVAEALDKLGWEPKNEEERVLYLIAKRQWNECIKIGVFAVKYLIDALGVKDELGTIQKDIRDELKSLLNDMWEDVDYSDLGIMIGRDENTGEEEVISTTSFPENAKMALIKICRSDAKVIDILIEALKDERSEVRGKVAEALGEIRDARAVDALIEALKDMDRDVRKSVVEALGKIKDTRAVDALIEALKDMNRDVRKSVVEALGEIGDARAVDKLVKMLNDEDRDVRKSVIEALGKIKDTRAVDALIEALKDMNRDVRKSVVEALGEIGDARAVDALIEALRDKDGKVRRSVAEALDKISWEPKNDEERVLYYIAKQKWNECIKIGVFAVKYLIDALEVKDKRVVVVIKTKKVQDQELKSLLKSSEDDQDIGTKTEIDENTGEEEVISTTSFPENAKMALIKICRSDAKVIDILIEALKDERSEVRGKVAEALGEIRDARAVDALIEAFRDKNSDLSVRRSVVWALREIGDVRAVEALIEALKDEDSDVRRSVAELLIKAWKDRGLLGKGSGR
jgi:HEAT repeat protein